jgi:two-component system OmpR family response regulator/two-component system response regulator RstA
MDAGRLLLVEDDERLAQLGGRRARARGLAGDALRAWRRGRGAASAPAASTSCCWTGTCPARTASTCCATCAATFAGRIVMLTARDDDIDQVLGLEGGADDYIAKPVAPRVLLARLKALMRRDRPRQPRARPGRPVDAGAAASAPAAPAAAHPAPHPPGRVRPPALRQPRCSTSPRATCDLADEPVALTTAEYELLRFLAERAGQVVSRDDIMQGLRGMEFDGLDRAIDARISRLRRKLGDDADAPSRIKTVRGQGYLFAPGPAQARTGVRGPIAPLTRR